MAIDARLRAANAFDAARFVVFRCDGAPLGWVRRDLVGHLAACPGVFRIDAAAVELDAGIAGHAARSEAMARVAASLAARGLLSPWRSETYEIGLADRGVGLFALERAAVRFFGFIAQSVHLNGLVARAPDTAMWIARRSPHKAIDPGMLDNLMGGGLASGLSVQRTLVKEAWEEAGIEAAMAMQARPAGTLRVCREVPEGLHAEILHVYDLYLPEDFQPLNQDGEVAEFRRLSLDAVAAELREDAPYTIDAGLVAIDCLRRLGALGQ
jgi:8-oxo-dGTP pyrophosphatase MutT (NUDIX family)